MKTDAQMIFEYLKTRYEREIALEIIELITKSEVSYEDWYVGITKDEHQRNEIGRNINIDDKVNYISRNAHTKESAYNIEEFFIVELKTQGGKPRNGGDEESTYVYGFNTNKYPLNEDLQLMLESIR